MMGSAGEAKGLIFPPDTAWQPPDKRDGTGARTHRNDARPENLVPPF